MARKSSPAFAVVWGTCFRNVRTFQAAKHDSAAQCLKAKTAGSCRPFALVLGSRAAYLSS